MLAASAATCVGSELIFLTNRSIWAPLPCSRVAELPEKGVFLALSPLTG